MPQRPRTTHDHEGHDHDHGHDHAHGPVLNPECTRELVLDIPAEEVSKAYPRRGRQLPEIRQDSRLPRRQGSGDGGPPPFASEIRKEVIDGLLPERFNKAVLELGVKPVGQPQVTELTVEDGQPLHVKAVFEFIPEFSIEGYQNVTVEKPSVEVTEEEFQHELTSCASRAPPLSRSRKTARWWMATGRRSPTRA